MSYALTFSVAVGEEYEFIPLKGQLVDNSSVDVGSAITTGISYAGGGFFLFALTAIPDNFRGGLKVMRIDTSEVLAVSAINPEEAEYVDAKISSDNINIETGLESTNIYVLHDQNLPVNDIQITTGDRSGSISNIQIRTGVR